MRYRTLALVFGFVTVVAWTSAWTQTKKTDAQIRQEIIAASIATYRGNCPCPYNVERRGHSCGARSAYNPPGGAMPLCYERDVTPQMVEVIGSGRAANRCDAVSGTLVRRRARRCTRTVRSNEVGHVLNFVDLLD